MKFNLRSVYIFTFCLVATLASGQSEVEMADTMRAEGKIYVVVAILALILLGLLAYVFFTDKKITQLEKKISRKKP